MYRKESSDFTVIYMYRVYRGCRVYIVECWKYKLGISYLWNITKTYEIKRFRRKYLKTSKIKVVEIFPPILKNKKLIKGKGQERKRKEKESYIFIVYIKII